MTGQSTFEILRELPGKELPEAVLSVFSVGEIRAELENAQARDANDTAVWRVAAALLPTMMREPAADADVAAILELFLMWKGFDLERYDSLKSIRHSMDAIIESDEDNAWLDMCEEYLGRAAGVLQAASRRPDLLKLTPVAVQSAVRKLQRANALDFEAKLLEDRWLVWNAHVGRDFVRFYKSALRTKGK